MVEGIIGKKVGMTQIFDETGIVIPATVIQAGPCAVIQKKDPDRDGYAAVQLGFVEQAAVKHPNKATLGHFKSSEIPPTRVLREFRFDGTTEVNPGDLFDVDLFQKGDRVHVTGTSKGKGFAGVVKRWGHHGGKKTHGSMFHRAPGSIGASAYPSHVMKGKKMPGHLGSDRKTVQNLIVVEADKEQNLLVVKGSVPGSKGSYLLIKKANFQPRAMSAKKEE